MRTNKRSKSKIETAPKLLFNIEEAAARLSMSVVSVRKLLRQERLKRVPDFRHVLISDSELHRFAASCQ
jgi:excisionase family DNA binding protein